MNFTAEEHHWINKTRKNQFDFSGDGLIVAMNERYAGYKWQKLIPTDKIDARVRFDLQKHGANDVYFNKDTETYVKP